MPKDAAIVVHINGASLNSKLSWDEIKQTDMYAAMMQQAEDSLAKQILDNPEKSGIDIKSDAYLFVKNDGSNTYIGFTCNIKDEKAFTSFMGKVNEGKEITKKGKLSVIASGDDVLSWSNDRFLVVGTSRMAEQYMGGTSRKRLTEDSLLKFATSIYDLKNKESIASDNRFSDMMDDKGDVHFWVNPGEMIGKTLPSILLLTKATTLIQGNATAATLSFENGKITINGKSYFNKELSSLYKKFSMKNFDEAMLKKIPSDNVTAVMAMNYPPDGLKALLELLGVDGLANMALAESGLNIDDILKAFKGDMMLAVTDFEFAEKEFSPDPDEDWHMKRTVPNAKILFSTSVNDKASFEKMVDLVSGKMNKDGGDGSEIMDHISYKLNDDWFVAGSDSVQVNSFSSTNTDKPFIKTISGHPMGGFIDIQKIIRGSMSLAKEDSAASNVADESLKYWQDIVFYGGEFKNDAMESHIEINMVDKNTNSLKQLANYFNTIFKAKKSFSRRIAGIEDIETENPPAP